MPNAWVVLVFALMVVGCASRPSPHTLPPEAPKAQRSTPPPLSPTGEYGEASFPAGEIKPLAESLPTVKAVQKSKADAPPVLVKAKVTEVCPKKGCWMKVFGPQGDIRVTFKDYGFFVPVELVGREVVMQGHYVVHTESVAEQKHLLEDARRPKAEIDAVKKDKQTLRFVASGVKDLTVQR